jgi:hypothetical protein
MVKVVVLHSVRGLLAYDRNSSSTEGMVADPLSRRLVSRNKMAFHCQVGV